MAVSGVAIGEVFTSSQIAFLYAGDVSGNQVIITVPVTQAPLDLVIVRPNDDFYFPLPADNGGNQFKLNQDIYVSYPNGRRQLWRYDGLTPQLIDSWFTDDGTRPTLWVIPSATVNTWADPDNPTVIELNTAYKAVVSEEKRKIGDHVKLETNGLTFARFDSEDGTQTWLPVNADIVAIDGRGFVVTTGSYTRDSQPVPADIGETAWAIGVRIEKVLPNGVVEIYKADTNTTSSLVRVELPTTPFTDKPEPPGWKADEIYRYLSFDGEGRERIQRYRWRSQAGTLVAYEVLASAS